jgi:aminoglycoside phosphotransferase (APT) family kinase protein
VSASAAISTAPDRDLARERRDVDDALRPGVMGPRLQHALSLPGYLPCHVLDAKYEVGSYCIVLYELGVHMVTGVLSLDGGDRWREGVRLSSGMRVYRFPDDPRLDGLRAAMEPDHMARLLGADRRARTRVTLLRYRPGTRATVHIDVGTRSGRRTFVAKLYGKPAKAAAAHREGVALARALAAVAGVRVSKPEGYWPELGLVLWQPVAGVELDPHLGSTRGRGYVRAVAEALVAVHELDDVTTRHRPVGAELERSHLRAENVARVAPDTGARLVSWAREIMAVGDRVVHGEATTVHGDCKPGQFRVGGSALGLLDFDHCGLADPASDVGTFLASLRRTGRRALEGPFVDAYIAASGRDAPPRDRMLWYESVALLRKALRAFARAPRSGVPALLAGEGLECLTAIGGARCP